jgi:hypothetical protein
MPLIYVTGVSTAGKSTVLGELRRRGYTAFGVDEDGNGRFVHRQTQLVVEPPPEDVDPHEWYPDHAWVLDVHKIARLAERVNADGTLAFLCGVGAGESKAWRYFDLVCALSVDEDTIRERTALRAAAIPDHFGSRPEELAQVLEWNRGYTETYRGFGAVIIDATRPPEALVDDILDAVRRAGSFE